MTELIKRLSVKEIYNIKLSLLKKLKDFDKIGTDIQHTFKIIKGYAPYRIDYRFDNYESNREERYIDRVCWNYLIGLFEFQKYMLCTDYEKMNADIYDFNTPDFNIENAQNWIDNIQTLIYDNVKKLVKQVFENITNDYYITGSGGWNGTKKKRNNNGIDKMFIIRTNDYSYVFEYCRTTSTITDDLEKVCYILSEKKLPDVTCKEVMAHSKLAEYENDYFKIKFCKNGNTHYWLNNDIREKLNYYGSGKGIIGENLRIKIL